jgi:catechol 2,3-dioxygenase-like lactoylglutathione lyase family enzyme
MSEEIYPMPFFPTLIVKDLEASSDFYQKALGFKHIFTMPGLVHLRWVKYADVLIAGHRDGEEITGPKGAGVALNFNMLEHFNGDLDAFATHARANGAEVHGPVERPWNVREVSVLDPDGYRLVFTVPLNIDLKFDEMLERVKKAEKSR